MSYQRENPYSGAGNSGRHQYLHHQEQQQPVNPYPSSQRPSNPYDQPAPPPYSSNPFNDPSRPSTSATNDMEMSQMPPTGQSQPRNNHYIMDECRHITDETTNLKSLLSQLQTAQTRALNDTTGTSSSPSAQALATLNSQIVTTHKSLIGRLKYLKSRPESGASHNASQIGLADRSLRDTFQQYRVLEADYQQRVNKQLERQYRIVRPDATEAEVREAVQDPNAQVFSQALMQSNRRGESRQVLSAVRERHDAIARIEQQMVELASLFQDMERMVVEQEPMVKNIEDKSAETNDNVQAGVAELGTAAVSARKARRKKWWCLLIAVLIVIVIVIVVAVVVAILH